MTDKLFTNMPSIDLQTSEKTKIVVFGDRIAWKYGGAEESMFNILSCLKEFELEVVSGSDDETERKFEKYPYSKIKKELFFRVSSLPFLEYFINFPRIKKAIRSCEANILFAQGMAAPAAILTFKGKSIYFVRDELSLNIYRCYDKTIKKKIKFFIRFLLDWPFMKFYDWRNKAAICKATVVVSNSAFISRKIQEIFHRDSIIIYPSLDLNIYANTRLPPYSEREYITMFGDGEIKGVSIFKSIAAQLQECKFMLVGRRHQNIAKGNIFFKSFETNPLEVYRQTKLLLVPSLWKRLLAELRLREVHLEFQ